MKSVFFSGLIADVWNDLREPAIAWQIGAILCAIVMGWLLAHFLPRLFAKKEPITHSLWFNAASFARVLAALFVLVLIVVAKLLLMNSHNVSLLRLTIPLFVALVLIRLVFYVLHPIIVRAGRAGRLLQMLERTFSIFVWVWFALYITGVWPELVQVLDDTFVNIGTKKITILSMLQVLASVVVTLLLALWGSALLEERLMRLEDVHTSFRVVLARTTRALLILIAILVSLSMVGIDLTVLSVFGGALGVGLGFGMQKIASNYVSGFIILLDRSLTIDDMITVDKYYGRVTQINTRYTVLRGLDGVESIIPNEMLVSSPVQNHSLTDRDVWLSTDVTVGYQTDIESLFGILEQATASVPRVSRDTPPKAFLMKFGADGLELRVGFWIIDPENGRTSVLSDINRAIWKALQHHHIEVPFPQRVIRMIDDRGDFSAKVEDAG
jgi:small-conductance mechanosensitive channel